MIYQKITFSGFVQAFSDRGGLLSSVIADYHAPKRHVKRCGRLFL